MVEGGYVGGQGRICGDHHLVPRSRVQVVEMSECAWCGAQCVTDWCGDSCMKQWQRKQQGILAADLVLDAPASVANAIIERTRRDEKPDPLMVGGPARVPNWEYVGLRSSIW